MKKFLVLLVSCVSASSFATISNYSLDPAEVMSTNAWQSGKGAFLNCYATNVLGGVDASEAGPRLVFHAKCRERGESRVIRAYVSDALPADQKVFLYTFLQTAKAQKLPLVVNFDASAINDAYRVTRAVQQGSAFGVEN